MAVVSRWIAGGMYQCVEQNSGASVLTEDSWRHVPILWSRPVAVVSRWIAGVLYHVCVAEQWQCSHGG